MAMTRFVLSLLSLLVLAVSAAQAEPPETPEPELLVWTSYTGPSLEWLETELSSFATATGHSFEIRTMTLGELRQNTVLAESDTRVADLLVGVPHDEMAELVELGLLADVSSYATQDYLSDLPQEAAAAFRHGRELLGLPLTLEGPALVVNTDLVTRLPTTYEEFLESAGRANRGLNRGLGLDIGNFYFAWAWLRSSGAMLFATDDSGRLTPALASDEAVAGALALQDLRFGRSLLPEDVSYEAAHELFSEGRLAYIYNGPWAVARYFEAGVPLTIMPVPPLVPGRPFSGFMSVQGVLVASRAADPLASANAAKWLVRSAAQLRLATGAGRIPASIAAVDELEADPVLHGYGIALRHAQAVPTVPLMAAVWQPMGRFLQELSSGVHTPQQLRSQLEQAGAEIAAD